METRVKKVWLGHVSIRDYVVKKCIDKKEDLTIKLGDKSKRYPYRGLRTHLLNTNRETFKSKYNGRKYSLIDFPWDTRI